MLKKIMKYNSSTSQVIKVSFAKALKSLETMQAAIANLTDIPATISPESQPTAALTQTTGGAIKTNEEQAGEYTKAEVSDTW